jgi:hypothetical protein
MTALYFPPSLSEWKVSKLTLHRLRCLTARRGPVTLIFKELESGDWYATKMRGGKVEGERTFASMPRIVWPYFDRNATRRRAA